MRSWNVQNDEPLQMLLPDCPVVNSKIKVKVTQHRNLFEMLYQCLHVTIVWKENTTFGFLDNETNVENVDSQSDGGTDAAYRWALFLWALYQPLLIPTLNDIELFYLLIY